MSCFDDTPTDKEPSYECPECFSGNVTLQPNGKWWECDECNFGALAKPKAESAQ